MAESSSGLKKSPSYREAQELLDQHIRRQRLLRKHGSPTGVKNIPDIRKEAEKILNEFLKKQLHNEMKRSPILSRHYQSVIVDDEYEQTEPIDDEQLMKGENFSGDEHDENRPFTSADQLEVDNIPFIDEVEDNSGRSKSLPTSIHISVKKPNAPASKSPFLTKSKSKRHTITVPTSPDNRSKSGSPTLSQEADSLEPINSPQKGSLESSKDASPNKKRRRFRSGSLSSSDTDAEEVVSPDRKKKSVFKRLQERVARAVSRDSEKMELDGKENDTKKKQKKRKARSKKRKEDQKTDIVILKDKHTHREGHVEQHRGGDNNEILLMTSETWESTDITDFEKSQSRHVDKHRKVKESTDLSGSSEKGFFGVIKRITSRKSKKNTSPKTSIKTSQSAYAQVSPDTNESVRSIDRILSLPSGSHDLNYHMTETVSHDNGRKHQQTTKCITSPRSPSQSLPKIGPIHEKSRSEPVKPSQLMVTDVETTGNTIPHNFRYLRISEGEEVKRFPSKNSFVVDYCVDEKERTIRTAEGEVKVQTDIHRSQALPNDVEIDGSGQSVASKGTALSIPHDKKYDSESDIEDDIDDIRISRVAARIAEMGDTYMSESSQVGSPTRSSDERDGEGLTELERKIRDCFRDFGDAVNEKVSLPVEPKQAAIEFAKQVTYSKFKDSVKSVVGEHVGWQQLAMVFYVTKKATQLAGTGGAVASQLKENCLQYVEDHFASWILNQGGWDSVLESEETDFDID